MRLYEQLPASERHEPGCPGRHGCTRCRSGLNPRMHTPSEERAQPPTTTCRGRSYAT